MTPNEYQKLAMRTNDGKCSERLIGDTISNIKIHFAPDGRMRTTLETFKCGDLVNGVMGLCGEAGEVSELIKKDIFHGHALDIEKVKKELGDVCWYIAMICNATGLNLEDVMQAIIDKLKKRHPNGFFRAGQY